MPIKDLLYAQEEKRTVTFDKRALRALNRLNFGKQPAKNTPKWILEGLEQADMIYFSGIWHLTRKPVEVEDGNGKAYFLFDCECDNTHSQNNTVCRYCFEKSAKEKK